jgi:hypothetical protein
MLYLVPNLLAQAVVLNRYLERIEAYNENGNETGVWYIYGVMLKKVFVFDLPEDAYEEDVFNKYSSQQSSPGNTKRLVQSMLLPPLEFHLKSSDSHSDKQWRHAMDSHLSDSEGAVYSLRSGFASLICSVVSSHELCPSLYHQEA